MKEKRMTIEEVREEICVAVYDAQGELMGWGGEENEETISRYGDALEIIEKALGLNKNEEESE